MNEQNYQDSANLSNLILNSASKQRKEKQEEEKTMLTSFEQATKKIHTHTQKNSCVHIAATNSINTYEISWVCNNR